MNQTLVYGTSAQLLCKPPSFLRQQAESLVQLLEQLQAVGTIKMTYDAACGPHGIARIDVLDPDAFRRWPLLCTLPHTHQP